MLFCGGYGCLLKAFWGIWVDVLVFGGGVIPTDDVTQLHESGVSHVFTPGTPIGDVVEWVRANVGVASVR